MSNSVFFDQSNLSDAFFAVSLDPSAPQSLQSQLLGAVREIIHAHPAADGTRLPATRTLAAELSVSRTTVQAVYDQLISEGYLSTQRGSGTYVAAEIANLAPPPVRRPSPLRPPAPWQPFRVGLPDQSLMPHKTWARHLEQTWRAPEPALLGRPDPFGWYPLRDAIARHLAGWRRLTCDPEQVVITSGTRESLEVILQGVIGGDGPVAVEDPCWPAVHDILQATGRAALPLRIDAGGLDPALIPKAAAAAIVTPSRHYPTGRSVPLPRRMALIAWAKQASGLIIEDDYDGEFRYRGQPLPSLAGLDGLQNVVYLGSFSKLIGPTLRIGYVVLPRRLLPPARAYVARTGNRASLVPQPALARFMQDGGFATHLRRMRRIYARRQKHLIAALSPVSDLLDTRPDPAGMHLCVALKPRLARCMSDRDIRRHARDAGLQIGALSDHCVLPDPLQALLIGYSGFDEDRLSEAAERLCSLLRGWVSERPV